MKINDLSLKNIFLFSWLMWLFFFLFKPFDYNYENIKLSSFLIFFFLNFLFYIGISIKSVEINKNDIDNNIFKNKLRKLINFLLLCSLVAVILRLYGIIFLQDYFSFETNYEFKQSIIYTQSSTGLIGVISAILIPSTIINLHINILFKVFSFKTFKGFLILLFSLFICFDAILKSSFFYIIFFFTFIFFSYSIRKIYIEKNFFKINLLKISIAVVLLFLYFSYIYQFRTFDINIILYSRKIISDVDITYLDFMFTNIFHYFLHGVYQWYELYNKIELSNYYLGGYQFYQYLKFFKIFFDFIPSYFELSQVLPKTGVYYTFWGEFIMDFGKLSFLFSFLIGIFFSKINNAAINLNLYSLILLPLIQIQVLLIPYLNVLYGFSGYYLFFIFVIYIYFKIQKI